MVARAGDVIAFLQAVSQGNRTRATIKALPAAPPRPRPYGILDRRLRLMRMRADQSAVGAINRHLQYVEYPHRGWLDDFVHVHHCAPTPVLPTRFSSLRFFEMYCPLWSPSAANNVPCGPLEPYPI